MLKNSLRQIFLNDRFEHVLRWILFLYVAAVLCPVRYLEFNAKDIDNTWLLALNYGAAHHTVHKSSGQNDAFRVLPSVRAPGFFRGETDVCRARRILVCA